jgi:hypothetical protein
MTAMGSHAYLDLFDDGIPTGNPLAGRALSAFDDRLLSNARFQVFLCALFGRTVVVPETWLVSSPTLLQVVGEVEAHVKKVGYDRRMRPIAAQPIFAFSFFSDSSAGLDPGRRYIATLLERLERDRTVRALETLGERPFVLGPSERTALVEALRPLVDSTQDDGNAARFESTLGEVVTDILGQGGTASQRARVVAHSYGSVVRYANAFRSDGLLVPWGTDGEGRFRDHMSRQVALVHRTVGEATPSTPAAQAGLQAFQSFFEDVRHRSLSFADVMGMGRLLSQYAPEHARTIAAFGRYVLNRGYAQGVSSWSYLMNFDFYPQGTPTDFEAWLRDEVLARERHSTDSFEAADYLELAQGHTYRLAQGLDWGRIWSTLTEVTADPAWVRARERLVRRLYASKTHLVDFSDDDWQRVFDVLVGRFYDFSFKVSPGRPEIVELVTRSVGEAQSTASSEVLQQVAGLGESAAQIGTIGLTGMNVLVKGAAKMIPNSAILRASRSAVELRQRFRSSGTGSGRILRH